MEEGFYEETFVASSGCDSFVDLFLTVVPDPGIDIDFELTDPNCFGDDNGVIRVTDVSGGNGPYTLFYKNDTISNLITSLPSGLYSVQAKDRFQCSIVEEVELVDPEEFRIELGNDTVIEFGAIYDFNLERSEDIISGIWTGVKLIVQHV